MNKQKNPKKTVGFEPRLFNITSTPEDEAGKGYEWDQACQGDCMYNTLWMTKGGFLRVEDLKAFWKPRWEHVRKMVDNYTTGEDMLMSAVIGDAADRECPGVSTVYANGWDEVRIGTTIKLTAPSQSSASSLGDRTSSFRGSIRRAIEALLPQGICTPNTNLWLAVGDDFVTNEVLAPCVGGSDGNGFNKCCH